MKKQAVAAGLNDTQAQRFAEANAATAENQVSSALESAIDVAVNENKNAANLADGYSESDNVISSSSSSISKTTPYGTRRVQQTATSSRIEKSYNQPYSVVSGSGVKTEITENSVIKSTENTFNINKVAGFATPDAALPKAGAAEYSGVAFNADSQGTLSYTVDFDERTGEGKISGLSSDGLSMQYVESISLDKGKISKQSINGQDVTGISSTVTLNHNDGMDAYSVTNGNYQLGLYGRNAEEVAGRTTGSDLNIGFGGKQTAYIDGAENQRLKDRKAELLTAATAAGLLAEQAKDYAESYFQQDKAAAEVELGRLVKEKAEKDALAQAEVLKIAAVDSRAGKEIPSSEISFVQIDSKSTNEQGKENEYKAAQYLYRQPYSIVVGTGLDKKIENGVDLSPSWTQYDVAVSGFATLENALPSVGKATYSGKGNHMFNTYDLTYNVDFANRTGSGYLTGKYILTHFGERLNLNEGQIGKVDLNGNTMMGISSTATGTGGDYISQNGTYTLGFFGTEAQEIGGIVEMPADGLGSYGNNSNGSKSMGFGGTRGEIKK